MELVNEWFLTGMFRNIDTPFCTESPYKKELLAALTLIGHALHKSEMEFHGNFGHTLGSIQHFSLMSRIYLCNATFHLANKTVSPTLPGFQGIKLCVQYLASHPHKPIFCPSNSYDGSNFSRLTWSVNQVEYHIKQNCLECHKDAYHATILNIIRSVSGIINIIIGVAVCCKLQIQPAIASDSTDGEIRCMYKAAKKTKVIRRYMKALALHTGAPTVHL